MRLRTGCCMVGVFFVLLAAVAWSMFGERPGPARAYNGITMGMTEKEVRSRFARFHPTFYKDPVSRRDRTVSPRARDVLAVGMHGPSWVYGFYLDSTGRVVQKYKFLD